MNMMFILTAIAGCSLVQPTSALAQWPPAWEPTSRRLDLNGMVKLGSVYVPAANPSRRDEPNIWVLEVGGQRSFWNRYASTIIADYSLAKLDVEYVVGQEDKPPFLFIRRNGNRKEFKKEDFTEKDLLHLAKAFPGAVEQFRAGELNMDILEAWIYKYAGRMKPSVLEIPELTEADMGLGLVGGKPNEYIIYRTKETIAADPALPTKELQDKAWDQQQRILHELAVRSVKFHGMLRVRKVPTDRQFVGKNFYEQMAPGSPQDKPIVILYWGSPNPDARERWGPFKPTQPAEGKAYVDDVERQVLFCLGLDSALAQRESSTGASVATVATTPPPSNATTPSTVSQPCPPDNKGRVVANANDKR
jgi:hypothetical protein